MDPSGQSGCRGRGCDCGHSSVFRRRKREGGEQGKKADKFQVSIWLLIIHKNLVAEIGQEITHWDLIEDIIHMS